ncbi:MAG: hypothetical protein ACFB20_13470 [Opitutales bacterium]
MASPGDCAPLLLLEASGPRVQVGVWAEGRWLAFAVSEAPALECLTGLVADVLENARRSLADVGGFLYDEGPGAVLGLRLAAMAIRTWQALPMHRQTPVFAFGALEVACVLLRHKGISPPYGLVTEAGLNRWLLQELGAATDTEPADATPAARLVDASELATFSGSLYHLAQRKQWKPLPRAAEPISLDLSGLPEWIDNPRLTRLVDQPTPRLPAAKNYVKWSGQRHRGGLR